MTLTAIHKLTNTRIIAEADGCLRDDYPDWDQLICPITRLPVFPRRAHVRGVNTKVRQHFAIKAPAGVSTWPEDIAWDPEIGEEKKGVRRVGGESWEHLEAKAFVKSQLAQLAPGSLITFEEVIIIRPGRRRIADVAIRYPSGLMEVHEAQLAALTLEELQERTDDYAEAGIPAYWWLGGNAGDRYELRDYLRSVNGGFVQLAFNETVPESAQHLVA